MEHQTLGRWDDCSIDPAAYYIEDCRISGGNLWFFKNSMMKLVQVKDKCVWSENWCFPSQDQTTWRHQSVRSSEWLGLLPMNEKQRHIGSFFEFQLKIIKIRGKTKAGRNIYFFLASYESANFATFYVKVS